MHRADAAVISQIWGTYLRAVSVELKAREQLEIAERLEQLEEDLGHKGGSSRRGHRPSPGDFRKRLVLDIPCNSGYPMQCPLVTSLAALDGLQAGRAHIGVRCVETVGGQGRHVGRVLA
jgi:hypothetical protein